MITRHGSVKMTGSHPSKVPDGAGDLFYEQDRIRDFNFLLDRTGVLASDLFKSDFTRGRPCDGGIVTDDGSHTAVNITAGYAYVPFAVSMPTNGVVPPATADETMLARVAWPALASQGALSGTATYYVKMKYREADAVSRTRQKAGGTWYFTQDASYELVIDTVAPAAGDVLLCTVGVTAGAISSVDQNAYEVPGGGYDLVVDSNAKLDAWSRATLGQFPRVLVRAGTWTVTMLNATNSIVDLDAAGTIQADGEVGSKVAFTGTGAFLYGFRHATVPTGFDAERISRITVDFSGATLSGWAYGFYRVTNLRDCSVVGGYDGYNDCRRMERCYAHVVSIGFVACYDLVTCRVLIDAPITVAVGFSSCYRLADCVAEITDASGAYASTGYSSCEDLKNCRCDITNLNKFITGFGSCKRLAGCYSSCAHTTTGAASSPAVYAYSSCSQLAACTAVASCASSSTIVCYGFNSCNRLNGCDSKSNNPGAGPGIGYYGCTTMGFNRDNGSDSKFSNCYADSASANAVADTAAGGYNS